MSCSPLSATGAPTKEPLLEHPKYKPVCALNEGTSGFVQLAQDLQTGEQFAIKFMDRGRASIRNFEREVLNLRLCSLHPHIVKLHEVSCFEQARRLMSHRGALPEEFLTQTAIGHQLQEREGIVTGNMAKQHGREEEGGARHPADLPKDLPTIEQPPLSALDVISGGVMALA